MFTFTLPNLHRSTKIALIFLFLATLFLRLWYVNGHSFVFFYDQARDAITATQLAHGDWKLFGPSASGTKDTIYHGVLYYYFLAPFYLLSVDPPQAASFGLAIFSALAIFPVFFLARALFRSEKIALLSTFFIAFSAVSVIEGTWLSNPALAVVFLPCFFYFTWRTYRQYNSPNLMLTFLFLGLSVQAAIFLGFWLILVIGELAAIYLQQRTHGKQFWLPIFFGGLTFLATTASMILSELLLIKRGILTWSLITQFAFSTDSSSFFADRLKNVFYFFVQRLGYTLLPALPVLVVALFLIFLCYYFFSRRGLSIFRPFLSATALNFLRFTLIVPLLFLLVFYRPSLHTLVGSDVLVYLVLTLILLCLFNWRLLQSYRKQGITLICLVFVLGNFVYLLTTKKYTNSYLIIQQGVSLQNELNLLDSTYQQARGQDFTFSSLTSPYNINTTWSYLYHYYGQNKYGYQPSFYGIPQAGFVNENLLEEQVCQPRTDLLHFSIYEPTTGIPDILVQQFRVDQTQNCGTPSASLKFGELELTY